MKKFFFLVFVILLMSSICVSCGDRLSSINPGLYEVNLKLKYPGHTLILKQRIRYNPDGTYVAANFENNSSVKELQGKFRIEQNMLIFYDNQQRLNIQDGTWLPKEQSAMKVRRMKRESYQCYVKYPDAQTAGKYKGIALSEGWETYQRISN